MDLFRRYLLSSAAMAPADRGGAGGTRGRVADAIVDDVELPDDDAGDELPDDDAGDELPDDDAGDELPDDDAGDELPDDDAGTGAPQDDEPAPRRASRADTRIRSAVARAQKAETDAANAMTRLAALEAQMSQRQTPQETPAQELDRLALMTPEERSDYKMNKALSAHASRMDNVAFNLQDQTDRAQFSAKLAGTPRYAKYAAEVETRLAEVRKTGTNLPREAVLIYLLGEKVWAQQGKPQPKQRGAERVRSQQARAPGGRGDTRNDRRAAGNSAEKRLENVQI